MERLTERVYGNGYCNSKSACEDDCTQCKMFHDILEKLAQYEDAEEQGLLLRLPRVEEEQKIRNKAIDEFAERIIELDAEFPTVEDEFGEYRPMTIKEMCSVIAEQMKGE